MYLYHTYVYMFIYVLFKHDLLRELEERMYLCEYVYICIYICIYIYMHVYTYVYVYIYIYSPGR